MLMLPLSHSEPHSDDLPVPSFTELPPENLSNQPLLAPLNVRVDICGQEYLAKTSYVLG